MVLAHLYFEDNKSKIEAGLIRNRAEWFSHQPVVEKFLKTRTGG